MSTSDEDDTAFKHMPYCGSFCNAFQQICIVRDMICYCCISPNGSHHLIVAGRTLVVW